MNTKMKNMRLKVLTASTLCLVTGFILSSCGSPENVTAIDKLLAEGCKPGPALNLDVYKLRVKDIFKKQKSETDARQASLTSELFPSRQSFSSFQPTLQNETESERMQREKRDQQEREKAFEESRQAKLKAYDKMREISKEDEKTGQKTVSELDCLTPPTGLEKQHAVIKLSMQAGLAFTTAVNAISRDVTVLKQISQSDFVKGFKPLAKNILNAAMPFYDALETLELGTDLTGGTNSLSSEEIRRYKGLTDTEREKEMDKAAESLAQGIYSSFVKVRVDIATSVAPTPIPTAIPTPSATAFVFPTAAMPASPAAPAAPAAAAPAEFPTTAPTVSPSQAVTDFFLEGASAQRNYNYSYTIFITGNGFGKASDYSFFQVRFSEATIPLIVDGVPQNGLELSGVNLTDTLIKFTFKFASPPIEGDQIALSFEKRGTGLLKSATIRLGSGSIPSQTAAPTTVPSQTASPAAIEKTLLTGKVYDTTGAVVDGATVSVRSLSSIAVQALEAPTSAYSAQTTTIAGSYVFNDVPVGVQLEIKVSKSGYSSQSQVEVLRSNPDGNPNFNNIEFGGPNKPSSALVPNS